MQWNVDPIWTVAGFVVDFIENFGEEIEAQELSLSFHVLRFNHASLRGRSVGSEENFAGPFFPSQRAL